MTELESRISKYLDGDLAPAEQIELRRELASNPEALAVYRELRAIRRAARRSPSLHGPSAATEARLFHQLHREGFRDLPTPLHPAPAEATRIISGRRFATAAASLVAVLFVTVASILSLRTGTPETNRALTSAPETTAPRADMSSTGSASADEAPTTADDASLRDASPGQQSTATGGDPSLTPREARSSIPATLRRELASASTSRGPARNSSGATAIDATSSRVNDGESVPTASATDTASTRRVGNAAAPTSNEPRNADVAMAPSDTSTPPHDASAFALAATDSARRAEPNTDASASQTRATPAPPALLPLRDDDDAPLVSAALRYGTAYTSRTGSERSDELSAGLAVNLGGGHQLAVLGGRSAAITYQHATNTFAVPARAAISGSKDNGAGLQKVDETPEEHDFAVGQEWWFGLGYDYAVIESGPLAVGLGVRGGVGPRSFRVGAELPISVSISRRIAIELVGSATRVLPHDRSRSEYSIESTSDGYVYNAESERAAFSTLGGAVGIRVALD